MQPLPLAPSHKGRENVFLLASEYNLLFALILG